MSAENRRATLADVLAMAPLFRQDDLNEARAEGHATAREALEFQLSVSGSQAWTLWREDKIMAMWGVVQCSLLDGVGVPWLYTTAEVDKHPRDFIRASREALVRLRDQYTILWNRVDARYAKALRWARFVGFEVGPLAEERGYKYCLITRRGA